MTAKPSVALARLRMRHLLALTAVIAATGASCGGCEKNNENNGNDSGSDMATPDSGGPSDSGDAAPPDADDGPGELAIGTLSAPLTARYDDAGVVHLECAVARDCFVGQGYMHARDRFLQMDLLRNQTRGRLSEMIGLSLGRGNDTFWRHRMTKMDGTALEEAYFEAASEETKDAFRAYAEGVNTWLTHVRLNRHGAVLPAEYSSGLLYEINEIRDWEPADSVTLYLNLSYTWSYGEAGNQFSILAAGLDEGLFRDMLFTTPVNSSVLGAASNALRVAQPQTKGPLGWKERLAPIKPLLIEAHENARANASFIAGPMGRTASNSWAVRPSNTKDGVTLLGNDPHLDMTNPPIWYLMEMNETGREDGLHVAGASVPGAPGIIIGRNERVAWSATIAVYSLASVYDETLSADGTAVRRDGQEFEIVKLPTEIRGRFGDVTTETFEYVPGHGPVIAKDEAAGKALSVRWVGQEVSNDIDFILDLMYANSIEEGSQALDPVRLININWVLADVEGNVGWYPKALVPERRPWISMENPHILPHPGDGSAEWNGWVPKEEMPELVNPAIGYLATNNNYFRDNWDDANPFNDGVPILQTSLIHGGQLRHHRSMELLASTQHDVESMVAMQNDTYSSYGEFLVPPVLEAVADVRDTLSPQAEAVVMALENWNYVCRTGLSEHDPQSPASEDEAEVAAAAGCSALHLLIKYLTLELLEDEFAGAPLLTEFNRQWKALDGIMLTVFRNPSELAYTGDYFDDISTAALETRTDVVRGALDRTGTWLEEEFGSLDPSQWLWGRIHHITFESLLGLPQYGVGPYATHGGLHTLAKMTPLGATFNHIDGGSVRLVHELGADGIETYFQLPGGNVHNNADSPFYNNLLDDWLEARSRAMLFTPEEVRENATAEVLVFQTGN